MSTPEENEKPAASDAALSTNGAHDPGAGNGASATNGASDESPAEEGLDDQRMTLLEHLQELRVRLRNAAIAFIVAMIVSFIFVKNSFELLVTPMVKGMKAAGVAMPKMQVTSPTEAFWVTLKIAMVGGILVAGPFVFWEIWKFVAPGLYKKEKRLALIVTMATGFCFAGGAVFGYFVLAEPAGYFLTKMSMEFSTSIFEVVTEYKINDVADFLMLTLAGCGAAFELPVVLTIMGSLGIVSSRGLWKFNKYALILSAVAGAVLTPSTDPFSQLFLAGPLFVLYNLSIIFVWMIERARKKKADDLDAEADAAS